jgi:hypothetical protein
VSGRHLLWALGALFAACTLAITGCGIPLDEEAQPLSTAEGRRSEIITGITTSTSSSTVAPDESVPEPALVSLYFIGAGELETVEREVADVNRALEALIENPEPDERPDLVEAEILLQTFIPPEMNPIPRGKDDERGVQRVQVSADEVSGLRGILQENPDTGRLIVSQLVCTVLNLVDVNGVEIYDSDPLVDGEPPAPIPLIDNSAQTIERPANEDDFGGCLTGTERRALEAEAAEAEATGTTAVPEDGPTVDG